MLHRGLSRIADIEAFDVVSNLHEVEAGAPVAGIFNNGELKLEASTNNAVDSTIADWKFLGFAFNKYMKGSNTKNINEDAIAASEDDLASVAVAASFFDSTTSNKAILVKSAEGWTEVSTKVDSKDAVANPTDYFEDAAAGKIFIAADHAGKAVKVQFTIELSAYAAALDNQFNPNICTNLVDKLSVITKATTVAIDSNFVREAGYIASGAYGKAPACYLSADDNGNFVIGLGDGDVELKNVIFKGFNGNYAIFELFQD